MNDPQAEEFNNPRGQYDLIVVGAGVAGLSAAYALSSQARVLVLERESQPAYHSSGRSAAMYIEGYENPVVAELTQASGPFFKQPPEFCNAPLLHNRGGLTAAVKGDERALEKYLDTWQPFCPNLRRVDPDEAQKICSILRREISIGGAYDPDWLSIDVHELIQTYLRGLKANGGTLLTDAEVTAIDNSRDNLSITTTAGTFQASTLVNAGGAWANHISALAGGVSLPLTPMRRTAAIIPLPEEAAKNWPLVHTMQEQLYFKPESPGLMVCPQDETPSEAMDAYPHDIDVAIAMDRLQQIADVEVTRVMHRWAGLRTFAPDRYPAVGHDPQQPRLFWLAGQGGFGVQTSPHMGQLIAATLLHNDPIPTQLQVQRLL